MSFLYENSLVPQKELISIEKKMQNEFNAMKKAASLSYKDERALINLPNDKDNLRRIRNTIKEKLNFEPEYLVVVGMGGSNLGAMAVQEAVLGKLHNQLNPNIKILYVDNLDSELLDSVIKIIDPVFKKEKNIVINIVSKSGTTTETIANFEILLNILKKYKKDYENFVVVTTEKNSKLWKIAMEKGFSILEIPEKVPGRYSVFSSAGLFPLGMIGIDIEKLLQGASAIKEKCLKENLKENLAALSASLIYYHYKKGRKINDLFLFGDNLESIGKWYRQLMAESIGKEFDKNGKKIHAGITPIVSIGTKDLHSMAQLYLAGPCDKFTSFVWVDNENLNLSTPDLMECSSLVENIQKRPLKDIAHAIYDGVKIVFRNKKRPFAEIILPDKTENSIGQFLQFKIMEIIYLSYLLNVNPFDQPNVELYKAETRRILKRKS